LIALLNYVGLNFCITGSSFDYNYKWSTRGWL